MLTIRKSHERGHADYGWLDTYHTFSFADYHDPEHMGFGPLRVINEDHVQPGAGFPMHRHRDMEIITYVLDGTIAHEDSMGHSAALRPGEVQRISAGTGIAHSELNPSDQQPLHFLQIWIKPDRAGLTPSYEQKAFPAASRLNRLRLVASPDGRGDSVTIHQNAMIYVAELTQEAEVSHALTAGRRAWVQVTRGEASVNDIPLAAGDGAAIHGEPEVRIQGIQEDTEVLLFDLP